MAARLLTMLYLLEETKKYDNLKKARQARKLRDRQKRKFKSISRDAYYIHNYRLSNKLINILETDLSPLMPKKIRSSGLTNRLKILCTLSFLASGSYQKIIRKNADTYMSQPSASRAIQQVVHALNNIKIINKYIKFPENADERRILIKRFYEKFKIPGVLGCVDGTLVSMIRPKEHEERYYCRKNYHCKNVMIINDADFNILYLDVAFGGATNDNVVFSNTIIKEQLESLNNSGERVYLLGDSAYAQRLFLMTPFKNPQPGTPEMYYNELHSEALNSVERTIGSLKGRFRCLLLCNMLHYSPITVGKIIIACCVLHNMCNREGLTAPTLTQSELDEETRLVNMLTQPLQQHDELISDQISRQDLVTELWQAYYI